VAAWLGGTTALFGYNVPNALLAGGVVIERLITTTHPI